LKHVLSLLAGLAIIGLAWILTFGAPWQVPVADVPGAGAPTGAGGPPTGAGRGSGGATFVTLAVVEIAPYTDVFRSVGTARAKASVTVETEAAGHVSQVHFGANQTVEAGALLLSLDDEVERIQLRTAQATLAEARSTLDRYRTLDRANSGAVSAVTLIESETQVELAEASLARAEYDLSLKSVRAPISGTLGLTDVETGVYLGTGAEVVTITDQSHLIIEFGLPDRAAGVVGLGQAVRLTSASLPGRVFEGIVEGYDGRIDSTTRTIKVRAGVDNPDGLMLPGMIFNVILDHQNEPLPMVPANSITWSRDGAAVWVVADDKVQPQTVAIRHRSNDRIWLEAELAAGAQVVVDGVQKLRPGATVTTADAGRPAKAGSN
jgi:RND family efflux transporter MFP subunit